MNRLTPQSAGDHVREGERCESSLPVIIAAQEGWGGVRGVPSGAVHPDCRPEYLREHNRSRTEIQLVLGRAEFLRSTGISRSTSPRRGSVLADPAVSSLDELDAEASILLVSVAIPWHRWSIEVIERHEEPHRGAVVGDLVLQHEEFDVPPEVLEQREKVAVPRQRLTEWAALAEVVPADALEREIEPVRDLPIEPAGAVDGLLAIDPVPRKDHHAADRVADRPERFVLFLGEQLGDAPQRIPPPERGDDRVATQEELAKFRAVMQVHAAHGVIQIEELTTWQCLAPQELVVLPKSGAKCVRVLSGRVSPEVERGVDQHASPVYRRREDLAFAFCDRIRREPS
jgi:hypothetical protein